MGEGEEGGCKMNPEIYRALASFNESLQTVSQSLDVLQAAGLQTRQLSELRKAKAEELRAEVTASVAINLHTREMETAFQVERERLRKEERLKKS
jgi:hypothetical protein